MDPEHIARLRLQATRLYEQGRERWLRIPVKARFMLGLFLFAGVLMALHTALSGADSTLHLKVQHSFRSADLSVWIDGDLVYSGKLAGSLKKRFGLIPDSVQGSLSQIMPVSSGTHQVRVRVVPDEGAAQEDSVTGDFARNTERDLSVSARRSGLTLAWQATNTTESSPGSGWFGRYAGSLLLTIAGSIISALTGFALREVPAHIRARQNAEPKAQSTAAGQ
ncbi:MAG: hypothetical protein LAO03_20190 [Acidobacteriia bacterium]|nr:hypothetical protein [Terriglobia bacterium]